MRYLGLNGLELGFAVCHRPQSHGHPVSLGLMARRSAAVGAPATLTLSPVLVIEIPSREWSWTAAIGLIVVDGWPVRAD